MIRKNILIVGGGVMGLVLLKALVSVGYKSITVAEKNLNRKTELKKIYSQVELIKNLNKLQTADLIFLAIKPQDFFSLEQNLKLGRSSMVVSIMAGVKISRLKNKFKVNKIVRAMPNMPAMIGQGFTVWTSTKQVNSQDKNVLKKVWQQMGQELYVESENWINKATAVTGSGPAYIFLTLKCFIEAAINLGFNQKQALTMTMSVAEGALKLVKNDKTKDLDSFIARVASKGGTTEAALKDFEKNKQNKIWQSAVKAAYNRSQELA